MLQRIVITLVVLLAAGLIPNASSAAETAPPSPNSATSNTTNTTSSAPDPADIHITSATWRFIAGVEILNTTSFISTPQAQSLLNQHAENLLDCYAPTHYTADGTMTVKLYIGATGIPVGVQGDTDGIAPLQARCMLKQAWQYEFAAPPTNEEQASIQYRVFFPTERIYSTPIAENRPNMIIEYVRATPETIPTGELTEQILKHSEDLRFCQTLALQQTPHDLIVTDVDMGFHKFGTVYRANNIDLNVTNQTTHAIPSNTLTDCIRRSIASWEITLPPTSTEKITTRFFITFQPPKNN